jgi:hypothetical protein
MALESNSVRRVITVAVGRCARASVRAERVRFFALVSTAPVTRGERSDEAIGAIYSRDAKARDFTVQGRAR